MESALSEDAYPFTLKHFRRRPVNIDRLPSHLWPRIMQKHAATTQLRLCEASSRAKETIEEVLPQIQGLPEIISAFKLARLALPIFWREVFPIDERISFYDWVRDFVNIVSIPALRRADRVTAKMLWKMRNKEWECQRRPLEEKWRSDVYGPQTIDLRPVPRILWLKITLMATFAAVCRLAASSSTGRLAAVTCIRSSRIIEFHAKYQRWTSRRDTPFKGFRTNADMFTESIWTVSSENLKTFDFQCSLKLWHLHSTVVTASVRENGINTFFFTADQLQEFQEYGKKRYLLYLKGKEEKDGRKELIDIALGSRIVPVYYDHTDFKE